MRKLRLSKSKRLVQCHTAVQQQSRCSCLSTSGTYLFSVTHVAPEMVLALQSTLLQAHPSGAKWVGLRGTALAPSTTSRKTFLASHLLDTGSAPHSSWAATWERMPIWADWTALGASAGLSLLPRHPVSPLPLTQVPRGQVPSMRYLI